MGRGLLDGQVAELVDDEELWLGVVGQLLVELPVDPCALKRGQQLGGGDEEDGVAGGHHVAPEGHRGLADPGWAEEQHVGRGGDESPGGQLPDDSRVDGRLAGEVEVVEPLDDREVGDLDAHSRPLVGL